MKVGLRAIDRMGKRVSFDGLHHKHVPTKNGMSKLELNETIEENWGILKEWCATSASGTYVPSFACVFFAEDSDALLCYLTFK